MATSTSWMMHLYKSTVDSGAASPYSTIAVTTIQAAPYSASSLDVYITRSGKTFESESFTITDVSGSTFGALFSRMAFNVKCYPFKFDASFDPDLNDINTIRNFLHGARYLWVRFDAGSRDQPSATEAYPVVVVSCEESINEQYGTHGVELQLQHKYRMTSY